MGLNRQFWPIEVLQNETFYIFLKVLSGLNFVVFRVQCSFVLGNLLHIFCTIFVAQIKMGFNKDTKKEQLDFTLPFVKPNLIWNEKLGTFIIDSIHWSLFVYTLKLLTAVCLKL